MADYDKPEGAGEPVSKEDASILKESRDALTTCIEDEQEERSKMLDDIHFATLDQWPTDVRNQRENDSVNGPRPCLTIDQINQYTTQVTNDMRANRPSIKIRPVDDAADPETAKVFQGLIRHIEDQSHAHIAYQTSAESAVDIGLGFFRIITDYVDDTSFDQEILIKRVPDTFSVYLSAHQMPDGSDAEKGWILEKVPIESFKSQYPKAKIKDDDFSGLGVTPTWKTDQQVTVCEYFYKEYSQEKLLFLADGRTVYKKDYENLNPKPEITGERNAQKVQVKWCKHTGCEVLDKRDWPGKYIPIVEEVGKEKIVDGKRVLWGLVRPAKDSLRAFNYWISALTEKMALAPKAPFIGAVGQFASQGDKWDKANINNYSKLEYDAIDVNGNAVPPPRRQEPMQMEPAMAQMLQIMQNNVKSSLGMYKASVGQGEGDQSGRAILALKKESDTGTLHFGENQGISIMHAGRIIVDLIPKVIDTQRVLRILGEDGKVDLAHVDPNQPEAMKEIQDTEGKVRRIYNLGVGKYDVTVTVGPGYTTSRQEAATVMTELANSAKDPISAAIMRYAAIKNSDFHGSEEITRMLKAMLPPQLQTPDGQEIPPQALQKMNEMMQRMQLMQEEGAKLQQENLQLKAGTAVDMAKVKATRETKMAELGVEKDIQDERIKMEREKAEADIAREEYLAIKRLEIERMKLAASADGEIDAAIAKVVNLAQMHQMKVQAIFDKEAAKEEGEKSNGEDKSAEVNALQQQFMSAIQEIVKALAAKKRVTMTLPGGRQASAEVVTH